MTAKNERAQWQKGFSRLSDGNNVTLYCCLHTQYVWQKGFSRLSDGNLHALGPHAFKLLLSGRRAFRDGAIETRRSCSRLFILFPSWQKGFSRLSDGNLDCNPALVNAQGGRRAFRDGAIETAVD